MIDKNTGHIIISDTVSIKPNDSLQDILLLNIGQINKQWSYNNNWAWLQENNVFVDHNYFIFQFGFFKDQLREMSFCISDVKFDLEANWDSWSEEKELANLESYKKWLANELGDKKDFDWGNSLGTI